MPARTWPPERVRSPALEFRWLACRLAEALSDALRVAGSRGQRIAAPQEVTEDA